MICPDCKGKGHILLLVTVEDPCATCEGEGEVPDTITDEALGAAMYAKAQQEEADAAYGDWLADYQTQLWPFSLD